jgi:hypothetical protein
VNTVLRVFDTAGNPLTGVIDLNTFYSYPPAINRSTGAYGPFANNVSYPALAVLPNGRGVIAFTVMGDDHYPSAGYASLDAKIGAGDIHIAAACLGPDDGFTGYKTFVGDPPRTRWGDYGAAATDGKSIWFASEYVAQTCTLSQYMAAPFGSCGGTRTSLGNWATRITQVVP